ncbi:MAG: VapE domain-containing protein [Bacteroidota bacterium]
MTNNKTKQRAAAPVTLFKGCLQDATPKGASTIGEVLAYIRDDKNKTFRQFSDELRALRISDPTAYKQRKERDCPAFIVGRFTERKNEACAEYLPLLGFDIDSVEDVAGTLAKLSQSPFVYAAFMSPSGEGLRFLVWVDSDKDHHKKAYQRIANTFAEILGIPTDKQCRKEWKAEGLNAGEIAARLKEWPHIDTSTNNLARLWFYTWVPGGLFYHNEQSQTFELSAGIGAPTAAPAAPNGQLSGVVPEDEKVSICQDKVNRQDLAPGRNNMVFALAAEFVRHGVGEARALAECLTYEEGDFGEAEIRKTVVSAYQTKQREFSDDQIRNYQRMIAKDKKGGPDPRTKSEVSVKQTPSDDSNRPKFVRIRNFVDRRYDLRLNTISNEIESSDKGKGEFEELNENDLICQLFEAGFNGVETPLIALLKSSFVPQYDPFQAYFGSLPQWNKDQPDYINQLAQFVEVEEREWFDLQFKKMLVRTVAGALRVIPFNKQCFVLKGGQNDGKSSFIRFLCPPQLQPYYTEQINVQNKDGRITLCQNFIINLDELSQFRKQDINVVKALMSVDHVKERLPYDRKPTRLPRRASFFGSTNNDEFLTDSTGSVRWLVMEIKPNGIRHDNGGPKGYNQVDIDQVYSQALALLKGGFKFNLTREEIERNERLNKRYQVLTVERELIQDSFASVEKDTKGAVFLTATDILTSIETGVKTTLSLKNVGQALRVLGFEQSQRYDKERGYQKKGYWVRRLFDDE